MSIEQPEEETIPLEEPEPDPEAEAEPEPEDGEDDTTNDDA